jgi:uncharacterized oxidoreductase
MELRGRTILITGGTSGIGLTLAKHLIEHNTVLVCGRSNEKLKNAKRMLPDLICLQCDISRADERARLFHIISANHPSLDVIINNAAIVHATNFHADPEMLEKADAEINTNLVAPIALAKIFLRIAPKHAAIINITTGLIYAPRAIYPIYNATKAALHSFTKVLRHQTKSINVHVIEVLMPVVDTPWHQGRTPKIAISPETAVTEMLAQIAKGKTEIKIGAVKILSLLARISPALAFRVINRVE